MSNLNLISCKLSWFIFVLGLVTMETSWCPYDNHWHVISCILFSSLETPVLSTYRPYLIICFLFSGLFHLAPYFEKALDKQDTAGDSPKSHEEEKLLLMLSDSSHSVPVLTFVLFCSSFVSLTHPHVVIPFSSSANGQLFPASYLGISFLLSVALCEMKHYKPRMTIVSPVCKIILVTLAVPKKAQKPHAV